MLIKITARYFFFLLVLTLPIGAKAQNLGDCTNNKISLTVVLKACEDIVRNSSKTDREISRAASRIALISQFVDKNKNNSAEVIGYFLLAAQKGDLEAYAHIGSLYRLGYRDLKINYEKALYYYQLDTSGSTVKMRGLGDMFLNGLGVEKSIDTALLSFHWLAYLDADDASTRSELCRIHKNEKYGKKDLVKAYFWCTSAVVAESYPPMKGSFEKDRMDIRSQMTNKQLVDAENLTKECNRTSIVACPIMQD
jgi:hypothetical protein